MKKLLVLFCAFISSNTFTHLSQTDAYFSLPLTYPSHWVEAYTKYQPLMDTIIYKERELAESHYVFYHGQQGIYRLVQDITTELLRLDSSDSFSDFCYIRSPNNFFAEKIDLEQFIQETEVRFPYGLWDNYQPDLARRLLSVNFSLFANQDIPGSATFEYFLNSESCTDYSVELLLKDFFNDHGFNVKYIPELVETYKIIKQPEGNLLQIFIPQDQVDTYAYICQRKGTPYRTQILAECYNWDKNRHIAIAPLLKAYKNNPETCTNIIKWQARLFITSNGLLNPHSGIKIYSYSTAPEKALKNYTSKIQELAKKIIAEKKKL